MLLEKETFSFAPEELDNNSGVDDEEAGFNKPITREETLTGLHKLKHKKAAMAKDMWIDELRKRTISP